MHHVLKLVPDFRVRAITRNPDSAKAKALVDTYGSERVELVRADVTDPGTYAAAFEGAQAAVLLTNFWDRGQMGKELAIGTELVRVAREAGVEHMFWSTLCNVRVLTADKYKVPHFSDKAAVDEVILRAGFKHVTFFGPAFYLQNLLGPLRGKAESSDPTRLIYVLPDILVDVYDVADTGKAVVAGLRDPGRFGNNSYLPFSAAKLKLSECVKLIGDADANSEFTHAYQPISIEEYGKLGFPGAEELAQGFGFFDEFGYHGNTPMDAATAAFTGDLALNTPAHFFAAHFADKVPAQSKSAVAGSMTAITFDFENETFLQRTDVPIPIPAAGEARIRVHSASLNAVDAMHKMWGSSIDPPTRERFVAGVDVAGVIDAIVPDGDGNTNGLSVGDRVLVHPFLIRGWGGLAQWSLATNKFIVKLPDSVSFESGAAIPCCGFTAYKGMHSKLRVRPGRSIVISGAAGSLGGFAVQLAREAGCSPVVALCSESSNERVLALGATHTVDYHTEDVLAAIQAIPGCENGVDFIFDAVSGENAKLLSGAAGFDGQVLSCNGVVPQDAKEPYLKGLSFHTISTAPAMYLGKPWIADDFKSQADALLQLVATGTVDTMVTRTVKLADAAALLNAGKHCGTGGKTVVSID